MLVKEIIYAIEEKIPVEYQEDYDNSGLQVGDANSQLNSVLLTLDVTGETISEAVKLKAGLIISHHPLIFHGLKNISYSNVTGKIISDAIKNNIAIYSCHTNLDSAWEGLNTFLAAKLGLTDITILFPRPGFLKKLVTFVPSDKAAGLRQALFSAGAGVIGDYDSCSYNLEGYGTFRGSEDTNPYVGQKGKLHSEKETRIEVIFPVNIKDKIISALVKNHPYEEPAYDIYPLENKWDRLGAGVAGSLENHLSGEEFLKLVKEVFGCEKLRYSGFTGEKIKKVAFCSGSGSSLLNEAIAQGAQAFVTSDVRYHSFIDAGGKLLLIDAGHFETEQFSVNLIYNILIKKFPNFAVHFSKKSKNPVNYF